MIIQKLTHYKKSYIIKSFKEYIDDTLTLYEKYNPKGNITYRYRKNIQQWQKWVYDENDNNIYYETSDNVIWYVMYNEYNNITFEVSNMGKYREFKYDELNRLISVEGGNELSKIQPTIIRYEYDQNGERNRIFNINY